MPRAATTSTGDVVAERVAKFDAYRETLDADGKADLDSMLDHIADTMRARGCRQFGVMMCKDLVMALVEKGPWRVQA